MAVFTAIHGTRDNNNKLNFFQSSELHSVLTTWPPQHWGNQCILGDHLTHSTSVHRRTPSCLLMSHSDLSDNGLLQHYKAHCKLEEEHLICAHCCLPNSKLDSPTLGNWLILCVSEVSISANHNFGAVFLSPFGLSNLRGMSHSLTMNYTDM